MLGILGSAEHIKNLLYHLIHHDVEDNGECRVALSYYPPHQKILPKEHAHLWHNPLMVPVGIEEAGQIWTRTITS